MVKDMRLNMNYHIYVGIYWGYYVVPLFYFLTIIVWENEVLVSEYVCFVDWCVYLLVYCQHGIDMLHLV